MATELENKLTALKDDLKTLKSLTDQNKSSDTAVLFDKIEEDYYTAKELALLDNAVFSENPTREEYLEDLNDTLQSTNSCALRLGKTQISLERPGPNDWIAKLENQASENSTSPYIEQLNHLIAHAKEELAAVKGTDSLSSVFEQGKNENLTAALKATSRLLSGDMKQADHDTYKQAIQAASGNKASPRMKILGGLMMALGLAVAALGVVATATGVAAPIGLGAAAGGTALALAGYSFFRASRPADGMHHEMAELEKATPVAKAG
ncbi:MAG: hypothetical protein QNK11_05425 [Legionella sp.]|nr:hypothetical protein [Legionella sp.]